MAAQPVNSFQSLVGIPVLYDRLKPEHCGQIGIPDIIAQTHQAHG